MAAHNVAEIQDEIGILEARLRDARKRLENVQLTDTQGAVDRDSATTNNAAASSPNIAPGLGSHTHFLLLLSDSQLPLGSFAFSSGLESYLAHTPPRTASFSSSFLPSSISSMASTTLPFVLAAHRSPQELAELDDQLDAAIVCTVGRRASVAQGRALLGIWERSFRGTVTGDGQVLKDFSTLLRESQGQDVPLVSAHLAPLFGVICALVGMSLRQTAYVFMLSHVKALVSAAVRASMFGPYQAQKVLASAQVQRLIDVVIDREWNTAVEDAGQATPMMDLWIGRHEVLYSRIFNS
ncbi:uncharacterized protein F5Z01DRAFT_243378 [Emericellopsis atlantica]|uniref:Urease accessory protein UreF n=1 Tax=Emericellopsis atlantica TaxID=2614577 RepID=A0A9P7ZIK3_9HYPO|nr:uncharacterized protein F5Z01DRAFT_243378 [Emericellopsis atlantica]KAG9252347.1 hypothetical protein F5Z01DRAFT_243378 [Emericellopsis atlantica]